MSITANTANTDPDLEPRRSGAKVELSRIETETGVIVVEVSPVYQLKTVAKIMDLTVQAVRRLVNVGELKAFETRAGKRVNHSDLVAFLEDYYSPSMRRRGPNAGFHKAMAARGITDYKGAIPSDDKD